jgi:hypothetical protein
MPMEDRPLPVDADVEQHRARIEAAVNEYIESLKTYIDKLIKLYSPHTRWWKGEATAINTGARTATVQSDSFPEADAPPPVPMGWGRPTWTAGKLVGHRVRWMGDNDTKEQWIDDTLS